MSNTKREPLLSDDGIDAMMDNVHGTDWHDFVGLANAVREHYEAARAKDAELIQLLVDALHDSWPSHHEDAHTAYYAAVEAAEASGFKPSDR